VIEWLIRRVLSALASITIGQWEAALELVQQAARYAKEKTGAERKQYVIDSLKMAFTDAKLKGWMLDVLVGLAFGFAKKKGYIK
jgi:uncharacterized membrane-anchored protein